MTRSTRRPAPQIISIGDAARVLNFGRSTAYEAAKTGELPVIKTGRRLLVPTDALDELLRTGHTVALSAAQTRQESDAKTTTATLVAAAFPKCQAPEGQRDDTRPGRALASCGYTTTPAAVRWCQEQNPVFTTTAPGRPATTPVLAELAHNERYWLFRVIDVARDWTNSGQPLCDSRGWYDARGQAEARLAALRQEVEDRMIADYWSDALL